MLTRITSKKILVEQFTANLQNVCGTFQTEVADHRAQHQGALYMEERAGLEIAHVATDLQMICRSAHDIRRDDGENYFLIFQEEGRALMSQNNTTYMLQPGDIILIDSSKPSEFKFCGKFQRQLSLHLPRREMWDRFGDSVQGGLFLPQADHTAQALSAVVSKAFDHKSNTTQVSYLREALFGLIGAMLYEWAGNTNTNAIDSDVSGADTLKRGIIYIDQYFSDNELSIPQISEDLGTSMRQLQRSFALIGTTPTDYLIQKRLEYACQLLRARRLGSCDLLVSTIAYASGFNDVSYFNRRFRRTFGCAPRQFGSNYTTNDKLA